MEKQWTLIIEAEPPHGSSLTTRKIAARSHNSLVVSGAGCFMFFFFFLVESARRPLNFYKVSVTFNDEKHFFASARRASRAATNSL